MSKEAMKLALEALENAQANFGEWWPEAITALREALAEQPAQQEPAGWRPATFHRDNLSFNPGFPDEQTVKFWKMQGVEIEYCYTSPLLLSPGATLYTSPPAQRTWVGLTDEEIERCMKQAYATVQGRNLERAFARAIEAKLRERNGIKGDA